jgi:hypothetical protein
MFSHVWPLVHLGQSLEALSHPPPGLMCPPAPAARTSALHPRLCHPAEPRVPRLQLSPHTTGGRSSPEAKTADRLPGSSARGSRLPGAPPSAYRGPQQGIPGSPTSAVTPEAPFLVKSSRKCVKNLLLKGHMAPYSELPGSPTRNTGVPNKEYRGPQQKLPGSPTKTTGVPNKNYRGPQQKLPGSPTRLLGESPASKRVFLLFAEALCIVYV